MTFKVNVVLSDTVAPTPDISVNVACNAIEYAPAFELSEDNTAKSIVVDV